MTSNKIFQRRKFIGGSDVAAILGRSRFRTPLDVYRSKTELEEVPDNLLFRVGRELEPIIAEIYSEETGTTGYVPPIKTHDEKPYLGASPDWLTNENELVEFKTLGWFDDSWGEKGTDEIPIDYYLQCQHYLYVFGAKKMDLIALERARLSYRIYTIHYNPKYSESVVPELEKFWKLVESKTPPEPQSLADVQYLYKPEPITIEATPEIAAVSAAYRNLKSVAKKTSDVADLAKLEILKFMKGAEKLTYDGETLHTYKINKNGNGVFNTYKINKNGNGVFR